MKSFSSSVINKSGKKFAPKAPVRRAAPAAPPSAPSRRASVTSQVSASHQAARTSETATPEPPPPASAPAPAPTSTVESSAPSRSLVTDSSSVPSSKTEEPRIQSSSAIPIPRPKRKASFSVPAPRATKDALLPRVSPSPPPPPPPPLAASSTEPVTHLQDTQKEDREIERVEKDAGQTKEVSATPAPTTRNDEISTEIRPSKRLRRSIESATATTVSNQTVGGATQLVTPPATQTTVPEDTAEAEDESESRATAPPSVSTAKIRKRRASRATSNDNPKSKKERKPRARKKREPTPEGAETVEIAPGIVKMSELCKDLRTGKMSKRETELRNLELAEQERKKAQQEGDNLAQVSVKETPDGATTAAEENSQATENRTQSGLVMRIVNGQIVLDAASLQVDRHADAARNMGEFEEIVENSLTRKVNQATYGKRSKTESWDEDMTDLFYRGLRIFGTDFMMISKLFPGRSRRQIKLKFNNEERRDPQRIKETLLGPRESIDISTYSELTNTVYDDPRVIQQELDEEKKQIEEQHEKERKAQEDLLRNPDGITNGTDNSGPDKVPVKTKRMSKKQLAKEMGGGTEEVLGTIDD